MPDKTINLNLSPEIEGAGKIYDLKTENPLDTHDVGLAVDILSILGLKFRDEVLKTNFQTELNGIQQNIADSIQSPNSGYLLELVIYVDTDGHLNLPEGRIIHPVGIGVEPLDAMANYLTGDVINPGVLPGNYLINNSSFLWIKKINNALVAKSIDKAFYDQFMQLANDEAQKRRLLGEWVKLNDATGLKEIQVAQYWAEVAKEKEMTLADEATKAKVEQLTKAMQVLQEKANELYQQFQRTQEEMVECQKLTNTLNAISAVAGLLKAGITANNLLSSAETEVKNVSDSALPSIEEIETINTSRLTELGQVNTQLTTIGRQYIDDMGKIHTELSTIYEIVVTPIPGFENNPLLNP